MSPTTFSDAPTEQAAPSTEAHTEEDADARPPVDRVATVHHLGRVAVLALPLGVLVAVITTSDPLWWQLHFSQLGTFADFSARTFNSTVIFSGFFLAAYGVFLRMALPTNMGRRKSRALRGSIVSAGLHLTVIGMIPIPVSPVLHDVAASGLGLSFLATVIAGLGLPGRSRRFRRATTSCIGLLTTGMIVLTAGFITLASFEFVAFVSMGIWLLSLPRSLAYRRGAVAASLTAVHVALPCPGARRAEHSVSRALPGTPNRSSRGPASRSAVPAAKTRRVTVRPVTRQLDGPDPSRGPSPARSDGEAASPAPRMPGEPARAARPVSVLSPAARMSQTRPVPARRRAPRRAPAKARAHHWSPATRRVDAARPARLTPARRINS